VATERLPVPEDIAALPDVKGSGDVHDLHQALVRETDGAIRAQVEAFIAEADPNRRMAILDDLFLAWTGSGGIDPGSRGPYFDARKLAVLEKFFGKPYYYSDTSH
jgi:hypothetical protein